MPTKTLGDPWRAKLIAALLWSPKEVPVLAEDCERSEGSVHGFLQALMDEGVVGATTGPRREGRGNCYFLKDPATGLAIDARFLNRPEHEKAGPQAGFSSVEDRAL